MMNTDLPLTGMPRPSYPATLYEERSQEMLVCPLCRIVLGPADATCPRDGNQGTPAEFEPIDSELAERFRVVEPFAQGDGGTLVFADEEQTGRRGVLKILAHRSGTSVAERQRLKRELVKQATLTDPALTVPIAVGETAGSTWFFRDWVDGVSLQVRLAREGALPLKEALHVASQLASALDELHRAGLLHRDLKPGHVLLAPQPSGMPHVTVIDAGVATSIRADVGFDVVGTPGYISPEQATGKLVSFRSDLYGLGCVLYEMLTGKPLFGGNPDDVLRAHAEQEPPAPPANLPTGLQALLTQLLSKEPRERPFSAQQVKRAVDPFLSAGAGQPGPTVTDEPELEVTLDESEADSRTPRPRVQHKATIMGMPAVGRPAGSKPPPPPPEQAVRPVVSKPPPPPGARPAPPQPPQANATPSGEPQPPSKTSPDSTQELDALDLEEVAVPVLDAGAGVPRPGSLDYDELAETTALDREQAEQQLAWVEPAAASLPQTRAMEASAPADSAPAGQRDASPAQPAKARPVSAFAATLPPSYAAGPTPPGGFAAPAAQAPVQPSQGFGAAPVQPSQGFGDTSGGFGPQAPSAGFGAPPAAQASPGGFGGTPVQAPTDAQAQWGAQPAAGLGMPAYQEAASFPAAVEGATAPFGSASDAAIPLSDPLGDLELPVKKSSKAGIIVLGVVLLLCVGTSAAGGIGWWLWGDEFAGELPVAFGPSTGAEPTNPGGPGEVQIAPQVAPEPGPTEGPTEPAEVAQPTPVEESPTEAAPEEAPTVAPPREERPPTAAERRAARREARAVREPREPRETAERPAASGFDALRAEARAHFQARRYAEAQAAYERAAAMRPSDAGIFAGLGATRAAQGNHRGAVAAYQRAVELRPNHSGFMAALGRAYMGAGDRARAIQAYQRAITLDPNNGAARQALERLGAH